MLELNWAATLPLCWKGVLKMMRKIRKPATITCLALAVIAAAMLFVDHPSIPVDFAKAHEMVAGNGKSDSRDGETSVAESRSHQTKFSTDDQPYGTTPFPRSLIDGRMTETTDEMRRHSGRNGALTEREMNMARVAWKYFENFTQDETGLANSVGNYPSTTLWDTASYLSGLVSAYELGIINKFEFDKRAFSLLKTFRRLKLFRGELPNKVYHTKTGEKVDYANKPGEIGYSALDIGRFLVWMRILKNRYPYLGNSIDNVLLRWNYCNVVREDGMLIGARLNKKKETVYVQEGRLGYEEYAAKGFGVWGFDTTEASKSQPYGMINIHGVDVPYDSRDPRIFHSSNYVVTEGYILDGLELNWDVANDVYSSDELHTEGWRAEFANRVYLAQQRRYEQTGYMSARSEHQVKGKPYFVYDTLYANGYPWNTVTPRGDYSPEKAAVATKAAIGIWALWDTEYSGLLFDAVAELYDPEKGLYEGLYENGDGPILIHTANNNGITLAALLYKKQGKILTPSLDNSEAWFTSYRQMETRKTRCLPDPPKQKACSVQCNNQCDINSANYSLPIEQYKMCKPVSAEDWYPGCPSCAIEPAAACGVHESRLQTVLAGKPGEYCVANH